jgi:NADPH2:quinone reductase
VLRNPDVVVEAGERIAELIASGHVRPLVGPRFPLERAGEALRTIDERRATGKVVLDVREPTGG